MRVSASRIRYRSNRTSFAFTGADCPPAELRLYRPLRHAACRCSPCAARSTRHARVTAYQCRRGCACSDTIHGVPTQLRLSHNELWRLAACVHLHYRPRCIPQLHSRPRLPSFVTSRWCSSQVKFSPVALRCYIPVTLTAAPPGRLRPGGLTSPEVFLVDCPACQADARWQPGWFLVDFSACQADARWQPGWCLVDCPACQADARWQPGWRSQRALAAAHSHRELGPRREPTREPALTPALTPATLTPNPPRWHTACRLARASAAALAVWRWLWQRPALAGTLAAAAPPPRPPRS